VYQSFMVDVLAMPVLVGWKSPSERFAGAINTMTCEAMMRDGKALQMGTSHELGQNFARAFDIDYLDADGATRFCWTTSWGATTRMIGGLIMVHGDDEGIVVPPRLAPVQAVVLLVKDADGAGERAAALAAEVDRAGVRARLDDRVATSFGRRATDWELKGVPVRIEVGPRDLAQGMVTVVRRDSGAKEQVPVAAAAGRVAELLEGIQAELLATATARREAATAEVGSIAEAAEAAQRGFARLPWALVRGEGEARLAGQGVTVRCLQTADGGLPTSEEDGDLVAVVARAY
jgi:prolyl-tRNA synthetase